MGDARSDLRMVSAWVGRNKEHSSEEAYVALEGVKHILAKKLMLAMEGLRIVVTRA